LLRDRKCLDALDQVALRDYLVCWQRLNECEADIAKRGILVKGYRGGLTKNPSVALARQYREHLLAWSKELGLTIGSRARLALPQPKEPKPNPFALLGKHDVAGELDLDVLGGPLTAG
jgi:P27 family predicted phage terminase small subunit